MIGGEFVTFLGHFFHRNGIMPFDFMGEKGRGRGEKEVEVREEEKKKKKKNNITKDP